MAHLNKYISLLRNVVKCNGRFLSTRPPPIVKASFLSNPVFVGLSLGVGGTLGYAYYSAINTEPVYNEMGNTQPILKSFPEGITVSRKVRIPEDTTGLKITLFQYPTCPFCCKVRAFLDYYGVSYDIVEVNAVLRQQIRWSSYKKVPILLVQTPNGYQQMNDSSMIVSCLASYLSETNVGVEEVASYFPETEYRDDDGVIKKEIMNRYFLMLNDRMNGRSVKDIMDERKWRKWADQTLVHTLSPNVYRTKEEAFQAFEWFSEVGEWDKHFSSWERWLMVNVGAYAMYFISKRLKKRHNLKDEVRQSLYDECNLWVKTIEARNNGPYFGGQRPNLADLAVYGVLSSIEGCEAFKDLLGKSRIRSWYEKMKTNVTNHLGNEYVKHYANQKAVVG
uniref:Prostaglandin E synthase 2 n=1 Tax=Cacopsylla melanoneura TaxID=428564 RepID=A0A8D8Y543_9HEMI